MGRPGDWIKAGGILGLAILAARATRTPLATILAAAPVLLRHLQQMESRRAAGHGTAARTGVMTREEAALILGVSADAGKDEILQAHRRLIQKNHPDLGGTDYLASKINQARDILLGE